MEKSATKNPAKLLRKTADLIAECEQLYDIKIVCGDTVKMKHVKRLRKKLYALRQAENIKFVHRTGKSGRGQKREPQEGVYGIETWLTIICSEILDGLNIYEDAALG